jgi:hypothetical protein
MIQVEDILGNCMKSDFLHNKNSTDDKLEPCVLNVLSQL